MSNVKTYYYRVLLPHGKLSTGVLRLAVEKDQSARLRLERETDGTVALAAMGVGRCRGACALAAPSCSP